MVCSVGDKPEDIVGSMNLEVAAFLSERLLRVAKLVVEQGAQVTAAWRRLEASSQGMHTCFEARVHRLKAGNVHFVDNVVVSYLISQV